MSGQVAEELAPGKNEWTGNKSIKDLSNGKGGINPLTCAAPAVAAFSDSLLFAYRGHDNDIIYQCLYKGGKWSQNTAITVNGQNIRTSDGDGPSLAVYNNALCMAYRSSAKINGEYPIMMVTLQNGLTGADQWEGGTAISIGDGENLPTDHAPSLTAVQGPDGSACLWLGWQKDSDLFTATLDSSGWTNNGKIPDIGSNGTPQSNYGPALCSYQGSIWVIFKARHSNQLMWAAYDLIGGLWSGNLDIVDKRDVKKKPKSDRPPGIVASNGSMYITYKGEDHTSIYEAMLTDQVWSVNKKIDEISTIAPITDASPGMTSAVQDNEPVLIMANKGVGTAEIGLQIYVSKLPLPKARTGG